MFLQSFIKKILINSPTAVRSTKELLQKLSEKEYTPYNPLTKEMTSQYLSRSRFSSQGKAGLKAF